MEIKNWCKHIKYGESNLGFTTWIHVVGSSIGNRVSEVWLFCPLCGKRKPK